MPKVNKRKEQKNSEEMKVGVAGGIWVYFDYFYDDAKKVWVIMQKSTVKCFTNYRIIADSYSNRQTSLECYTVLQELAWIVRQAPLSPDALLIVDRFLNIKDIQYDLKLLSILPEISVDLWAYERKKEMIEVLSRVEDIFDNDTEPLSDVEDVEVIGECWDLSKEY